MIFDRTLLFSNAQAITATAASTDCVDLGATGTVMFASTAIVRDIGKGACIPLLIQVVETFNNLTSMTVTIQCDDNSAFSSPKDVLAATLPLASLVAGRELPMLAIPPGVNERYMRINYTVTGTGPSLGKVTAGIVAAVQTNGITF